MTQNSELNIDNSNILKEDVFNDDMFDDLSSFIIGYIKEEISKPNIKAEIIKPLLIHLLYYIIPFIIGIVLMNFITTILAVFIAFRFKKNC
tara:strand:- start:67 stop:339 length:273 start_codon:yes stop_codon:yes gene_type:complete